MHREKKTLTLQTGGCSLPSATSASSVAVVDREASSGCRDQAASVQMASNDSPTNVDCSKCLYKSTTTTTTTTNTTTATSSSTIAASNGSSSCASRQPPKQPSTPPPLISPSRALGNGFSGPTPPRVLYGLGHHSNAPQANSPYLPLHTAPYSSIGVASPPSPRCYDIIEEEMIFPMSDITEEDEEHTSSNLSGTTKSNKETSINRSRSPLTIPTIITEDVDSDLRNSPEKGTSSSWSPQRNGASAHQAVLKSKSAGSNQPRGASLPESGKSGSSTMGSTDAHPTHYHTVHGTSHIGHHHQCSNAITSHTSPATPDGACHGYNCKQRNRSHSGPVYPIAFPQSMRHTALISGGMATLGASSRRRQSDDSEQTSSSLRSRVSPSGSSFFDSFRPRSTSDSKSKKPSVITAFKNNFFNRGHNSSSSNNNNSNSSSSSSSSSNSCTNVNGCNNNNNNNNYHHAKSCGCVSGVGTSGHGHLPASPNCSSLGGTEHQGNGCLSAPPLSPSNGTPGSVIDPFALEFIYARSNSVCSDCSQPLNHRYQSHAPQRPRSRSGSSGPTSTMARVLDIFRGRSNSIATTNAVAITAETCCSRPTITHQDSICDREFEDIDENLVYVKFFKFYRTYDIVPISAKLVVFDTLLAVKKAFFALLSNGVRAAPLWDSARHAFVGMLTITDFILILRTYYNSPDLRIEELEDHKLDIWRNMLKEKSRPLVSIGPDESLFNAIKTLIHNKVHRLPVIDSESGNVLYILTHKRILKFLFLYYYSRLPMPSYLYKTLRDLPTIGTYENIAVATQNMPLIQTLNLMVDRRVSALPIVDKRNKVVEIYAKFDVIHLAADKAYQNLDIPVKKALEYRSHSERIIKCTMNDTLHAVLEKIVQAEVHRIIVVNNDDHVIGIISLSDLLTFLVLRPVGMEQKDIMATSVTAVSQNINCCKVVLEETAEEVALSDSQSSSGGSSAADLTAQDRAQLGPDGLAGSLEETNQLTTSSTGSSSATSSSSMLDGDRSTNPSPAASTAKNLSNLIATTSAKQTLIAPLQ